MGAALILIIIVSLAVVASSPLLMAFLEREDRPRPTPPPKAKKHNWYDAGPWRVVSNGEQICIQQGSAGDLVPIWIHYAGWLAYASEQGPRKENFPYRACDTSILEPTIEQLPKIREYCAELNEKIAKRSNHDAWIEMNKVDLHSPL